MRRKIGYRHKKRRWHGRGGVHGNYIPNGNITVNKVTYVHNTQLNHVRRDWNDRPFRMKGGNGDGLGRKPKLWRFVASCGLLDQDKFARMSEPEMVVELADVMRYTINGAKNDVKNIVYGIGEMGSSLLDIGKGVVGLIDDVIDMFMWPCRPPPP